MRKFSQKQTNQHTLHAITSANRKGNAVKKVINKFKGMAERLEVNLCGIESYSINNYFNLIIS